MEFDHDLGYWFGYYFSIIISDVLMNLELSLALGNTFLDFPLVSFSLAMNLLSVSLFSLSYDYFTALSCLLVDIFLLYNHLMILK